MRHAYRTLPPTAARPPRSLQAPTGLISSSTTAPPARTGVAIVYIASAREGIRHGSPRQDLFQTCRRSGASVISGTSRMNGAIGGKLSWRTRRSSRRHSLRHPPPPRTVRRCRVRRPDRCLRRQFARRARRRHADYHRSVKPLCRRRLARLTVAARRLCERHRRQSTKQQTNKLQRDAAAV